MYRRFLWVFLVVLECCGAVPAGAAEAADGEAPDAVGSLGDLNRWNSWDCVISQTTHCGALSLHVKLQAAFRPGGEQMAPHLEEVTRLLRQLDASSDEALRQSLRALLEGEIRERIEADLRAAANAPE